MKNEQGRTASWMAVAAALTMGAALEPANAQQAAAVEDDKEILVTATRREQALQDTPIAITAVSEEQLERGNVVSTADLQRVAPTLLIQSSNSETGGSTIRIRGVGTTGNNAGLEGAVGVFIDGVYRQRAGLAMNNLFDVGRIEVLRGPQGTLFGKNTSAGAISVVPNTPRLGEFDGSAKVGVSNFNGGDLEGMINLPLGETAAVRIAGAYQTRDGYVEDVRSGQESYNRDRRLVRGMLLWEPSDNITWRGTVDYAEKDEACCAAVYRVIGGASVLQTSLVPGAVIPTDPTQYNSLSTPSRPLIETTEDSGVSSHLTIDFGGVTFKNILAHRQFSAQNEIDADFGVADILYQKIATDQELTSAEATLNGNWGILDWLVGGYYANETVDINNQTRYGADLQRFITPATGGAINAANAALLYPTNGGTVLSVFEQEGTSYSFFTHNQIQLTERFGLVLGYRANHEEKEGGMPVLTVNSPSCGGGPFNGQGAAPPATVPNSLRLLCPRPTYFTTVDEDESTGTFGANFKLAKDVFAYASFSRGYKAGGINLDRDAPAAVGINPASGLVTGTQAQVNAAARFNPEFSESTEVGVRSQFFDRTLTLNVTAFQTDYEDFQLNTFNGLGFTISNAGTVESKGFEVEGMWKAGEDVDFTFGVAQVVAKYGREPALLADPADAPGTALNVQDFPLAGRTLTNAPKWSISTGMHYEHEVHDGVKGFFDISASYRTHYNTGSDLALAKEQPAFTTFNGRLGLFSDGENNWELALYGTNLGNQYSQLIAFDTVFQAGSISEFPAPPRMYGVSFKKNF